MPTSETLVIPPLTVSAPTAAVNGHARVNHSEGGVVVPDVPGIKAGELVYVNHRGDILGLADLDSLRAEREAVYGAIGLRLGADVESRARRMSPAAAVLMALHHADDRAADRAREAVAAERAKLLAEYDGDDEDDEEDPDDDIDDGDDEDWADDREVGDEEEPADDDAPSGPDNPSASAPAVPAFLREPVPLARRGRTWFEAVRDSEFVRAVCLFALIVAWLLFVTLFGRA